MKKHTTVIAAISLTIGMFLFSPLFSWQSVNAAVTCDSGLQSQASGLCLPAQSGTFGGGTINGFVLTIINLLLTIAATIAILFIVWGGFQYILSAGNSEKAENGQKTLTNAIIGLAIIILAFTIVGIVNNTVSNCLASGGVLGCF